MMSLSESLSGGLRVENQRTRSEMQTFAISAKHMMIGQQESHRKDRQNTSSSSSSSSSSSAESAALHLALVDLSSEVLHSTELARAGGGASSSMLSIRPSSLRRDGAAGREYLSGLLNASELSLVNAPVEGVS